MNRAKVLILSMLICDLSSAQTSQSLAAPGADVSSGTARLDLGSPAGVQPDAAQVGPALQPAGPAAQVSDGEQGARVAPAPRAVPPKGGDAAKKPISGRKQKRQVDGDIAEYSGAQKSRPERLLFERRPLRIAVSSSERLITFPNPVAFDLPNHMAGQISTQNIGRTVYVSAASTFEKFRVIAEDLVTGHLIPIDIMPAGEKSVLPEEVLISYGGSDDESDPANDETSHVQEPLDMVQLTRFAAQSTYAPKRLIPSHPLVHAIPMDRKKLAGLYRGPRIDALPLQQWRSGELYVTAVQLTNLERTAVALQPDQIRGAWLAATLQNKTLQQAGSERDTTTVYLVCGQPFHTCR